MPELLWIATSRFAVLAMTPPHIVIASVSEAIQYGAGFILDRHVPLRGPRDDVYLLPSLRGAARRSNPVMPELLWIAAALRASR
jgi:hypothetical protein